jgi:hypothetical protein
MAWGLLYGNYSMQAPSSSRALRAKGFTLVDVMGAVLVIGLALSGVFVANTRALGMIKSAKQAAVASKCLQQRIEQIRNYNWTQVTDAVAMQDLYGTPPLPSIELPGFSEQVTISAYTPPIPPASPTVPTAPFLQITRGNDGTVALVSDNANLVSQPEVRVDVQITWPGPNAVTRTRETSVVVANGGIGR